MIGEIKDCLFFVKDLTPLDKFLFLNEFSPLVCVSHFSILLMNCKKIINTALVLKLAYRPLSTKPKVMCSLLVKGHIIVCALCKEKNLCGVLL